MSDQDSIQILDLVRDSITGFGGRVTAICDYAYGTNQVQVTAAVDSNDPGTNTDEIRSHWLEEYRLQVIERAEG